VLILANNQISTPVGALSIREKEKNKIPEDKKALVVQTQSHESLENLFRLPGWW
jgi:hypothetical protein